MRVPQEAASELEMKPLEIDVEIEFTEFARTFRGGAPVSEFVERIPDGSLNADYYFPEDNVIAELKTLEVDALDPETFGRRVMASYKHFGYELSDFTRWLFRQELMPEQVSRRVYQLSARPVVECVKKAHKQIVATRRLLNQPVAQGLVLVANSANTLEPKQAMSAVLRGYEQRAETRLDAAVYFTPNVYHDLGDDIPYELWVPVAGDHLQQFVDGLGGAWFDYRQKRHGPGPRKTDSNMEQVLAAQVIRDW